MNQEQPPQAVRAAAHPYARLGPDQVLDALSSIGLYGDGRLLSLNSYENRVYLVYLEDGDSVVVKFYRPQRWSLEQIQEEHRFAAQLLQAEIPVVAPTQFDQFEGFHFAVYPRCGGRAPELDRDNVIEWIGRYMGRIHSVGAKEAFAHRPLINLQSYGIESRDFLLGDNRVSKEAWLPMELRKPWEAVVALALEGVGRAFERAKGVKTIRLHGDCHPGNILWNERGNPPGPHFVDLDDARMGPAIQDLWMLLSGSRAEQTHQLSVLLDGYEDFAELDRRELALIEPLRTLRLLHYSAWIARRWDDPAFPAAFPWFNTQRYWQDRILELREQVAAMQEEPLVV